MIALHVVWVYVHVGVGSCPKSSSHQIRTISPMERSPKK